MIWVRVETRGRLGPYESPRGSPATLVMNPGVRSWLVDVPYAEGAREVRTLIDRAASAAEIGIKELLR